MVDSSRAIRSAPLLIGAVFLALLPVAAGARASTLGGGSSGIEMARVSQRSPRLGQSYHPTTPPLMLPSPLASEPLAAFALQQIELSDPGAAADDCFGTSVALSGDTALVGACVNVNDQLDPDAVYIFTRSGTGWSQQAKLSDPNAVAADGFGGSVALVGDTALVGASSTPASGQAGAGAVYVFTRSGSTWSRRAELTAADAAAGDYFGDSVALSGGSALVGAYGKTVDNQDAAGAAYVFTGSGASWSQQAELMPSDPALGQLFGGPVALSGGTALIGAAGILVGPQVGPGAAYVFARAGTTWTQQAKLTASDGVTRDYFGKSLALFGNTALIGASCKTVGGQSNGGVAYIFIRSGTRWSQKAELGDPGAVAGDVFGGSVTLSGDTALIGAGGTTVDGQSDAGVAYIFTGAGANWSRQARLVASDAAANDYFGGPVALSGDVALVGAWSKAVGGEANVGAVYAFPDTTSPTVKASGATNGAWRTRAATITFSATDDPGGSGVGSITYTLDAGAARTVAATHAKLTIAAPASHANDGLHTLTYYATDKAGNSSAPKTLKVGIDTARPQPVALKAASRCRHNATIKLSYEIKDRLPGCGKAQVTIAFYRIPALGTAVFLTQRRLGLKLANHKYTYAFHCTLTPGFYLYMVKATDRAGNSSLTSLRYGSAVFRRVCRKLQVE